MTERPLDCPFCGARRLRIGSIEAYQETEYRVVCTECGATSGRQVTAALAVQDWNAGAGYWLIHRYDIEIEEVV